MEKQFNPKLLKHFLSLNSYSNSFQGWILFLFRCNKFFPQLFFHNRLNCKSNFKSNEIILPENWLKFSFPSICMLTLILILNSFSTIYFASLIWLTLASKLWLVDWLLLFSCLLFLSNWTYHVVHVHNEHWFSFISSVNIIGMK